MEKLHFPEKNTIVFGQDHSWFYGVPSDVEWEVSQISNNLIFLKAPGYGGEPYGNGGIVVYLKTHEEKKQSWISGKKCDPPEMDEWEKWVEESPFGNERLAGMPTQDWCAAVKTWLRKMPRGGK